MRRRFTAQDKRFMAKVRKRRAKGWTWPEIAANLGKPQTTVYQRFQTLEAREVMLGLRSIQQVEREHAA